MQISHYNSVDGKGYFHFEQKKLVKEKINEFTIENAKNLSVCDFDFAFLLSQCERGLRYRLYETIAIAKLTLLRNWF